MLDKIPNTEEMMTPIGQSLYDVWQKLRAMIEENRIEDNRFQISSRRSESIKR